MSTNPSPRVQLGDLDSFERDTFTAHDRTRDVWRKGSGPAVIVITEMPGLSPQVLGFADRLIALGCSAILPDLYGTAGRNPTSGSTLANATYGMTSIAKGCISRDFSTWALDRTSPIASWLRALARHEHERCGGPGVGAIGMCFSGGFALAMATDPAIVAPVLCQPALPFPFSKKHRRSIDVSTEDLETVAGRCSAEGMRVLGLRFNDDPLSPKERFGYLSERLGDGFIAIELDQADGNPAALESPLVSDHHSVLTHSLVDEPGQPTRDALDQVLNLFQTRLLRG